MSHGLGAELGKVEFVGPIGVVQDVHFGPDYIMGDITFRQIRGTVGAIKAFMKSHYPAYAEARTVNGRYIYIPFLQPDRLSGRGFRNPEDADEYANRFWLRYLRMKYGMG